MALGDVMVAPSLSQSSRTVTMTMVMDHQMDHIDELGFREDGDGRLKGESEDAVGLNPGSAAASNVAYLPQTVVLCDYRHEGFEESVRSGPAENGLVSKWRPKERIKTGCVALALCLNIGVDPPDVIKMSPCARMECWIDPHSMAARKALETIGKTLHAQYERWQPRARYKPLLDPTVEEVKKLCDNCRKYARSERVLFHYNGHGVPKPTSNGEIWVFNKSYTQYIPLPISDIDSRLKTPSMYVFDCSAAGMIVNAFIERLELNSSGSATSASKDCILLAACEAHQTLPQSSDFPADLFTSCLTTPIKMALWWFCSRSLLHDFLDHSLIDKIPGRQNDRRTLLGELNWIFTAVTDAIAWNVLPHDLFQRLFRQDLLVASLFRNFLLAERILRTSNCSPISYPFLPSTHQHPMWDAWDMAAEICLSKLPSLIADPNMEFQPSPFFTEQLTAFEVWLDHGSEQKKPPEQLPIVLQVLLSQSHRFRALELLGRFLDMGPWAVDLALSVGIFYVLKLLQTTTVELRPILVFIWTKILALDKSCQVDLVKDGGHAYFIRFLDSMDAYPEQRAMAAFVLAVIMDGHRHGQEVCVKESLIHVCLRHLQLASPHEPQTEPLLLQWLCLCIGKLWEDYPEAQFLGLQLDAPAICVPLLSEPQPEVRASAVFALGTLLDIGSDFRDEHRVDDESDDAEKIKAELNIARSLLAVVADGSPLVRAEVAVALSRFAFGHNTYLKSIAATYWRLQSNSLLNSLPTLANFRSPSSGNPGQYMHGGSVSSQIGPVLRVGSDSMAANRHARISTSSPLASTGILHGSPISDDSSQHSDSSKLTRENSSNGIITYPNTTRALDNALYFKCVLAMSSLAKDPSPRVASLGRRTLSIIGFEQVSRTARYDASTQYGEHPVQDASSSLAGLIRSSSWFDLSAGHLPMAFRTHTFSPPRQNILRRSSSLEFRPHQLNSPDPGLADPLLGTVGSSASSEHSLLPQSTIYNWSCGYFSRPLLPAADENEEIMARREVREKIALDHMVKCQHCSVSKLDNQLASWDTKFETGTKATLLLPFSPIVVGADKNERIRVWNYCDETQINSFDNHNLSDRGISKLCLVNELDDCLLLVASCDANIRIWKDFTERGKQKLVTAFSSAPSHRLGPRSANAVIDWQQQSGYLYSSGDGSSLLAWDLDKEQSFRTLYSSSESKISALSASQAHGSQFAAGFMDGSIRVYDVRTPDLPVCARKLHTQGVEMVVGIGFQPGLDPTKLVSASQAGDIKFLDMRNSAEAYLTINAHRGSLTSLAVHRHAPIIASGSTKQIVKVFSLEGRQLNVIKSKTSIMGQIIGPVSLSFHPYRTVLAAGAADSFVTIFADDGYQIN